MPRDRDPTPALERFEELYRQVAARLDELIPVAGDQRGTEHGTWSVKDTLNHIARWDELSRPSVEALVAGATSVEEPDYRLLNARWVAEDEPVPLEEARRRFERAHAAYRDVLRSLGPDHWSDAVREYVETSIEHYEDHLRAPLEFEVAPGG